ncbi:MAG: DNA primase, partial [Coleofasciculus sp. Co-bin14]|nr:DNA primase [Coleofasciculus sp. Co-bin14]
KTPSFSVSPSKQMYYSFGCNAGGNAIKFLMELGKRSFSDVVLDLARRYQVSVKTLEPEHHAVLQRQLSLREQLYEILALAVAFYQHTLRQPQGKEALTYLKATRRLSEETIQHFQLGYAPASWDTIYKYLVEHKGKPVQLVEQAGLIKPRKEGGGYYDRFRNRIIIPIHDTQGRAIGFGGRALGDEQPKYLNSPETELFNKGKTLFALDKARDAITKQDRAVVVEGYFDAIALHAAGITNVVASLGTALSIDQVRQLLRYTDSKQIVLNFDADAAGTQASERAIGEITPLVYGGQVQLRVLNLPEGKDADEFLKAHPQGDENYRELLQTAPLWLDWQISQLLKDKDLQQADQFQQVAQEIVKLLNQLDDINKLTYYINHCAQLLSQGQTKLIPLLIENLQSQVKKPSAPFTKKSTRSALRSSASLSPLAPNPLPHQLQNQQKKSSDLNVPVLGKHNLLEQAEALLLLIYLHCPEYRNAIIDILEERDLLFSLSHHRFLWQQILELQPAVEASSQASDQLLSLLQDCSIQFPTEIAQVAHLLHLDEKNKEDLARTPLLIRATTACMERVSCEKHRRYCLEQWQKLEPGTHSERREYYFKEFCEIDRRIRELDQLRQFNITDIIGNAIA